MFGIVVASVKKFRRYLFQEKENKQLEEMRGHDGDDLLCDVVDQDIKDIKRFNYALWELLKEKGFTDKELDKQLDATFVVDEKKNSSDVPETFCEKCNRKMQRMDSFRSRCIYCGASVTVNPYQMDLDGLKFNKVEE